MERNLTIDEIAERMAISRTTAFSWVGDIPIPVTESQTLAARRAGLASKEKHSRLRQAAYEEGLAEFDQLATDRTFRDFICMYIGEGTKRERNKVAICNSDPVVMQLSHDWLKRLTDRPLKFYFHHHADQDVAEVRKFWASELDVSADTIGSISKSNSGNLKGRTWRSRNGVLTVRVSDTRLRSKIEAWMDRLKGEWGRGSRLDSG